MKRSAIAVGRTASSAPQMTCAGLSQRARPSRTGSSAAAVGWSGSTGTSSGNASAPAFDSGVGNGALYAARISSRQAALRAALDEPRDVELAADAPHRFAEPQPRLARRAS